MKNLFDLILSSPPLDAEMRDQSSRPLRVDAWVASSLLQKSIRRGEAKTASMAALAFHRLRGAGIWRRFCLIAFEDVGAASIDAVCATVVAANDPRWRAHAGGDEVVIVHIARLLAEAEKDRSADHAICIAHDHPASEHMRETVGTSRLSHRLDFVADSSSPLIDRCVAAWYSSGIEWGAERRIGAGDLNALGDIFRCLGVPEALVKATCLAAKKTREPICLAVPLIWLQAFSAGPCRVITEPVPPSPMIAGIPAYAFDKHTAVGKAAIHRFATESRSVRHVLEEHVAEYRALEATCLAAFYADAAPISQRLDWPGSTELEKQGIDHDLISCGVHPSGVKPLLQAVRDNLEHLHEIRARMHPSSKVKGTAHGA